MSQDCDNNCAGCAQDCDDRTEEQIDFTAHLHPESSVKKLIAVMSGKGGVGKSLVASLLAVGMMKKGYRVAVLDADVTGPSIPKSFGLRGKANGSRSGIFPVQSKGGIEIMSLNLLLENDTDPVVWRGPIIGGTVKQFWTDVIWQDVDYMFIDGHRRRTPDHLPVTAGRWRRGGHFAAGAGFHGRDQIRQNGGNDEDTGSGRGGKHVLLQSPRYRH